jgi:biopolymer transport protein ExbD
MHIAPTIRQKSTDWVLQFINIVFLLLLYFLVNGAIIEQQRSDIELPLSIIESSGQPPHDAVYINRAGDLYFHDVKISVATLAQQLATGPANRNITLVTDRQLPAVALIAMMDKLRQSGLPHMSVVTLNKPGK